MKLLKTKSASKGHIRMEIVQYRVQNYKAINDTIVKLNYSINPVIGVNESGKTSILQAIFAFDYKNDKKNSGLHLEFQNKYQTKPTIGCKISSHIRIEKKDLQTIAAKLFLKTGTHDYTILNNFPARENIILSRELSKDKKPYALEYPKLSEQVGGKLVKILLEELPYILYFDDFTDRVPENIPFSSDYKMTGKLANSKNKEWQEIIVEIFRRADVEGIEDDVSPLKSFFHLKDDDRRSDILSDIQDILNKEIIEEWKRIKQSGHNKFADDSENLSLELKYEDHVFTFKVKDKSFNDKKRTFNIDERSKGFQWFFNYMIKLKFNPRYKEKQENSIFLLDEPGSYLHSSAQSELLAELRSVSKKNTIIYCTHSQYLLNPKVIQLGSIKIAEKSNSVVTLIEYGSYKGKDDKGALSAVYQALQLNFMHDFVGKIIITEGSTDTYFFELINKYTKKFSNKLKFIPGSGSGNLANLISIGISFSENFLVLFDNDEGKSAIKKYKQIFGDGIISKFFIYSDKEKFRLESFLCKEDKQKLRAITDTQDLKKALSILFYDISHEDQKNFIESLESQTWENLTETIEKLNSL